MTQASNKHKQAEQSAVWPPNLRARRPSRFVVNTVGRMFAALEFPGKGRLANVVGELLGRAWPEADCFPHSGARVTVLLADRIERFMWAGLYEPAFVSIMKATLRAGMVFADIGAHIGYFSVLAASLVTELGRVYAFEPSPPCFARLSLNLQDYSSAQAYQMAVSDQSGEQTFFSVRPDELGWGTLLPTDEPREPIQVQVTTMDEWWAGTDSREIHFMKLDAEGAEYRILLGAKALLERFRPVIFLELNEVWLDKDDRSQEILLFLQERDHSLQLLLEVKGLGMPSLLAIPNEMADTKKRVAELPLKWGRVSIAVA